MKKLNLILGIFLLTGSILAQTPQAFKYQAIARDNLGNVIANQVIGLQISILMDSAGGTPVYVETHIPQTNQFGLFSINIGEGAVVFSSFSNISWGIDSYFIQTELDASGGALYTMMGTSQLLSVPYALFSENAANVNDADHDPTNELQTISKVGKYIELSMGGGSVLDAVDDADNDPTNELQTISKNGSLVTLSHGGGSFVDAVDDADNDPANELQTISKIGSLVTLSHGGGSFVDAVDDADNDPTNELQTLSVLGSDLTISNGNTVSLPSQLPSGGAGRTMYHNGSVWNSTNNLYNNGTYVGVGTTNPLHTFEVNKPVYGGVMSAFTNTALGGGSTAIKSVAAYDTYGYLGVQGSNSFDGHYGLNISGDEIGVLGVSLGASQTDNYGVYGFSNGVGVYGEHYGSKRFGYLGENNYGVYGASFYNSAYGYLGADNIGAAGNYGTNVYGHLGTPAAGVYGYSNNSVVSAYGGYFKASHSSSLCIGVLINADYTGTSSPPSGHYVTGIYNDVTSTKADSYGIINYLDNSGTTGASTAIRSRLDVGVNNSRWAIGVESDVYRADDNGTSYAFKARAVEGVTTYGIHSQAYNGITNYAGYFAGNVTVTGTFSNPSDIKFKENLNPIIDPLDKIKNLNTYSYNYKSEGEASKMNFSEGRHYGFVAHELENIFPELVSNEVHSYDEIIEIDGKEDKEEHSFNYKGINYIEMIPILTQAIKDQQEIIERQQEAIDKQQQEIEELQVLVKKSIK